MLQRVAPTNNGGAGAGGVPVGPGPHCAIETAFQARLVSVSSAAFGIHFDKICKRDWRRRDDDSSPLQGDAAGAAH